MSCASWSRVFLLIATTRVAAEDSPNKPHIVQDYHFKHIGHINDDDVDEALTSLRSAESDKIKELQGDLSQFYDLQPKNSLGLLSRDSARLALHEYFVRRYGWYVAGIETGYHDLGVDVLNDSAALRAPWITSRLITSVEASANTQGIDLHHLATIAAGIHSLVLTEADRRIAEIYREFQLSPSSKVSRDDAWHILLAGAVVFLYGSNVRQHDALHWKRFLVNPHPSWEEVKSQLAEEVKHHELGEEISVRNFSEILVAFQKKYVDLMALECQTIKAELVRLSARSRKHGRVRLPDFYRKSLEAGFAFAEKREYLRDVGALDDQNPNEPPYVIIPNYVIARSNCVSGSHLFDVCCRSECEALVTTLKDKIEESSATPSVIADVVGSLSSASVQGPRTFPAKMLERLNQIAEQNHGIVNTQSRAFAQWMHFAFPLECPYVSPPASTISPTNKWAVSSNSDHEADEHERQLEVDNDSCPADIPANTPCAMDLQGDKTLQEYVLWSDEHLLLKDADSGTSRLCFAMVSMCLAIVAWLMSNRYGTPGQARQLKCLSVFFISSAALLAKLVDQTVFIFGIVVALLVSAISHRTRGVRDDYMAKKLEDAFV